MEKQKITKKISVLMVLAALLALNTVMTCALTLWLGLERASLRKLQADMAVVRDKVDREIELREELFPQLKKSAALLRKYNPRLDLQTALAYAYKIYQCSDTEVSMDILTALIVVESNAQVNAMSPRGALGLTQVMPGLWNCDRSMLVDPYKNIEIGASILRNYIRRHGLVGGLSAYNSGKNNRSLPYAHKVLGVAEQHF